MLPELLIQDETISSLGKTKNDCISNLRGRQTASMARSARNRFSSRDFRAFSTFLSFIPPTGG
jgi:hypothetical protein